MKLQFVLLLASLVADTTTAGVDGIPAVVEECLLGNSCIGTLDTICADYADANICEHGTCTQMAVAPHYFCECTEQDYVRSSDMHYCFHEPPATPAPGPNIPVVVEECLLGNACIGTLDTICADYADANICEHGDCVQYYVSPHFYCNCTEQDYVLSDDEHYCFLAGTPPPAAGGGSTSAPVAAGTAAPVAAGTAAPAAAGTPAPAAAGSTPAPAAAGGSTPAPGAAGTPAPVAAIDCPAPNGCASNSIDCEVIGGINKCLCEDTLYVNEYVACQNITACYPENPRFCWALDAECVVNEVNGGAPECWCPGDASNNHTNYRIAFYSSTC